MRWPWGSRGSRHRVGLGRRVITSTPARAYELMTELDELGYPLCAVDRNGARYTTATAAGDRDWWHGAAILTTATIRRLDAAGLLPLREVDPRTNETIL